jgi:hypothetical protein
LIGTDRVLLRDGLFALTGGLAGEVRLLKSAEALVNRIRDARGHLTWLAPGRGIGLVSAIGARRMAPLVPRIWRPARSVRIWRGGLIAGGLFGSRI